MNEQDIPIEITATKLLDWLESRKIVSKNWQSQVRDIRSKISNALNDMPVHPELVKLLSGSYINYFHCLQIVEILKTTEADTKSLFGRYGSQRMNDWQNIVRSYEKENVYLAEAGQILQRQNVEVPGLRKQRNKIGQLINDAEERIKDLIRSEEHLLKERQVICQQLGIKGVNLKDEFIARIKELPKFYEEIVNALPKLRKAIEYYLEFSANPEFLPLVKHILEYGNTTVYQWKSGGQKPNSILRPSFNYKLAESTIDSCESNQILGLDDDITTSTDGIQVEQSSVIQDTIDFDTGEEVDWSAIDTVPELVDPTLSSNGDNPHYSISDAIRDAAFNGSSNNGSDGIARGNDALTILENRSTYAMFIGELHRVQSFLKQRLNEYRVDETILMTFIMQNAPASIQKINENDLNSFLKSLDDVFALIVNRQLNRLYLMRDSYKFVDRLINRFEEKKKAQERNRLQQQQLEEKMSISINEEQQLKIKLNILVEYTKQLKEQVAKQISTKKCQNRRINIMGEINNL